MGQEVATAVALVEDEIANLRSLITELRPAALDELGLGAAIEGLVDNHTASTGMDTQVVLSLAREGGVAERLDRELESGVYRLVQEALTNVSKHAEAETVWIEVEQDKTSVSIVVRDDGIGFDMDSRPTGFGLIGMRERVALAGGSLTIVSTPGTGTVLRGRIPLERPARGLRREDAARPSRGGRPVRRPACPVRGRSGPVRSVSPGGAFAGCGSGVTRRCER